MTSPETCKKLHEVREIVEELYRSIGSLDHSDKIAAIDKAIEDVEVYRKLLNSDPCVIGELKDAKSALESGGTGDYIKSIDGAITRIYGLIVSKCPDNTGGIYVIPTE